MSRDGRLGRRRFIHGSANALVAVSALATANLGFASTIAQPRQSEPIPDKLVVLTFDDAVKSHRTVVAPLLKELGFAATFFITHRWMDDGENFLSWEEVAEIFRMGFEIGNHSWIHGNFSIPKNAARLAGQLSLVEYKLAKFGVPRPVSFAYSGNRFGPEAVKRLAELGYKFARRGMQPEVEYGKIRAGPPLDPKRHHPLLTPTTGDAYPDWTLQHFQRVVAQARNGQIVVLQFHGVPDPKHPWVHTPPERFREYMDHLKSNEFRVVALRDMERYVSLQRPPADPLLKIRYGEPKDRPLELPAEVEATRAEIGYWLGNMLRDHHYTLAEAGQVCGLPEAEVKKSALALGVVTRASAESGERKRIRILPYPGGRHARIGFLSGSVDPLRGTKASIFLSWDAASYVVVDLPEAIFSNSDLIFLAHTHIPTIWDNQNVLLENVDWERQKDGGMSHQRVLPNGIAFGSSIRPEGNGVVMQLWLRNGTAQPLTGLRAQICVLLKGAQGFNAQTNENKIFFNPVATVRSVKGDRWILTAWQQCGSVWGQQLCPCMHSDPVLPDCAPGQISRVRGRLWFYQGKRIEQELERALDD